MTPLFDYLLYLTFKNGEHRLYDVKPLFRSSKFKDIFCAIKNIKGLFEKVKVGRAGLSIAWNSEIDLDGERLYDESIRLDNLFTIKSKIKDNIAIKPQTATTRTKKSLART